MRHEMYGFVILALLLWQSSSVAAAAADGTITITDDRGREITVPYPLERIVFLVENAMNTMYAVGGAESVVGIGDIWMPEQREPFFRAIDPQFDQKVRIAREGNMVNLETLASADPQLVVLWSSDWDDDVTMAIENNLGVPTYGVFIDDPQDIFRQVKVFSEMIGDEARGQEVKDIMNRYISLITDRTEDMSDADRPKVYWMWGDILGTAGLNSTMSNLIYEAGGINVLSSWDNETITMEHPTLNLETLVSLNPDIIYMWYNAQLDPEDIISGPEYGAWKDIDAVKNGRVYELDNPLVFDAHTPRMPLALMRMAKDIQPELFQDLDLDSQIDNMFVELYSVHYPGYEPA